MKKLLIVPFALLFSSAALAEEPPKTDWVAKCKTCHGPELAGKAKAPAIAGEAVAKLKASLTTKIPKPMTAISKAMTPADIDAVSDAISKLPKPPAPPPAPATP